MTTILGTDVAELIWDNVGDATIYGLGGDDVLTGFDGDNRLYGGDGDDKLIGSGGDDYLKGGDGEDMLYGGSGTNLFEGGGGADLFILNNTGDIERIRDFGDGADRIDLRAFVNSIDEYADLTFIQRPNATDVLCGNSDTVIRLLGVEADTLSRGDFMI